MTLAKGIFYADESSIKKALNIPEHFAITAVIHDPKTNEFEFIVYTKEPWGDSVEDVPEGAAIERKS